MVEDQVVEEQRHVWRFRFDEVLVLLFFAFLLVAGLVTEGRGYEPLDNSKLTLYSVLGLFILIFVAVVRYRFRGDSKTIAGVAASWWPVILGLLEYETLKHLHANRITAALGIAPKDGLMLAIDELLFGAVLPLRMEWMVSDWFSHVMWFFYIHVYYLTPFAILAYFFFFRTESDAFFVVRRAIISTLLGGYVLYLLVPVAGPLFLIGDQFKVPILGGWGIRVLVWDTLRYNWDCFPSLHTAVPWVVAITAYRYSPIPVRIATVFSASMITLSTLYLRFHYGIDIVAGLLWAAIVGWSALVARQKKDTIDINIEMTPQRSLAVRRAILGAVFVATGAVALVVEQVFEKLLSTIVGASGPAAAIVLAMYFLGFAIGGFVYARFGKRLANPLLLYGLLELFVGAWALLLFFLFSDLQMVFSSFIGLAGDNTTILFTLRLLASAFWVLPPTIAMGATFPAMIGGLRVLGFSEPRKTMVMFYALNLVGATVGSVLAPYKLFPEIGLGGTLLLCALVELSVFMVILTFPSGNLNTANVAGGEYSTESEISAVPRRSHNLTWVAALAFLSGFVFFSIEVVWVHLIGVVIGTSVYAFSNMLFAVLLGLFLGSYLIRRLFKGHSTIPTWMLALVLGLAGFAIGFWMEAWDGVPAVFLSWGAGLNDFGAGEVLRVLCCLWLITPTATILGMLYPLIFRIDVFPVQGRDQAAGLATGCNAVGSFSGALITGLVLLPAIGSQAVLVLLATFTAMAGMALAFHQWYRIRQTGGALSKRGGLQPALILAACVVIVVVNSSRPAWDLVELTSGANVYFSRGHTRPDSKILFWHEDLVGGITTVVENNSGDADTQPYRVLLTNGEFQGNDNWEMPAQTGFALVPLLYTPEFDNALVIGLGTGHSARTILSAGFRNLEIVEIAPGIVQAAREHFGHINGEILDCGDVRLIVDDGRNALIRTDQEYDLISMEISSIWFAGATNLYSREFYSLAKSRLAEGGVLQQWVQLHHISPLEVQSVVATMRSEFENVEVWYVGQQGVLVASSEPLTVQPGRKKLLVENADLAGELRLMERWGYGDLDSFVQKRLLTVDEVTQLSLHFNEHGGRINTDMNRFVEYATPRYNLRKEDFREINIRSFLLFVHPGERDARFNQLLAVQ